MHVSCTALMKRPNEENSESRRSWGAEKAGLSRDGGAVSELGLWHASTFNHLGNIYRAEQNDTYPEISRRPIVLSGKTIALWYH